MSRDPVIRPALPSDLDELVRLHERFVDHHRICDGRFTPHAAAAGSWRERIAQALDDPLVMVLLVEVEGEAAGCSYVLVRPGTPDIDPGPIGYLCDVYVVPGLRRSGLARAMLDEARAWLRAQEVTVLETCWAVNAPEASATWPALGFTPLSMTGRMEV